jgi:hypothetical protein
VNFRRILDARLFLDAAAHVHPERTHRLDGFDHILRRQAAGQDHFGLPRQLRRPPPIGQLADAARRAFEQHARRQGIRRLAAEAHDGKHLDMRRNFQFAQILDVGLKIVRLENSANLVDLHLQRVLCHRDAQMPGGASAANCAACPGVT